MPEPAWPGPTPTPGPIPVPVPVPVAAPADPAAPIEADGFRLVLVPADVLEAVGRATERAEAGAGDGSVEWPGVGPIAAELASSMPAAMRLRQIEADPTQAAWLIRGIVVPDPTSPTGARVAGHLGGHGPPDDHGTVEAGYTVAVADRGRGLAGRGAAAWFAWAASRGATTARLSIEPGNGSSLAIAHRLGLVAVDRVWDEDDRVWELVHTAPLPLARSTP